MRTEENEMTFGHRLPDRVRLWGWSIPQSTIVKILVKAHQEDYKNAMSLKGGSPVIWEEQRNKVPETKQISLLKIVGMA